MEKANDVDLEIKYKVKGWKDPEDFLTMVAKQQGRLLKGGEPDLNTVAKMIVGDWQKGRIPYYYLPPGTTEEEVMKAEIEGEEELVEEVLEADEILED